MANSIVVFTEATSQDIIANRGSGEWILNPDRASQCKYLVVCRKTRWNNREDAAPNGAAFLVGVIKRLVPGAENQRGQRRYFIEISEFARISKDGVWKDWRNPVRYEALKNLGIDARALKLEPVPGTSDKAAVGKQPPAAAATQGLTIAEAKKALAATFGVRPDDVEIHIRG